MKIGIPREIKAQENRVALTPAAVRELSNAGHSVSIERDAGRAVGFSNEQYQAAGATILASAKEVYAAELILKVKEPQPPELPYLHAGQILFTYLHLAAAPDLAQALMAQGVTALAYETVTDPRPGNHLPLLIPMSEIAGRLAAEAAATSLHMIHGGRGVLMGGVPGVAPAKVVVLGGGTVGTQAAIMSMGLGAEVTLLDVDLTRLRERDDRYGPRLKTRFSDAHTIDELTREADAVIGAVLLPGHSAPKLLSKQTVQHMQPGAVLVDVAIDQGGCAETSRPTTHASPRYRVDGVVHYCVANMPSASARTATQALSNATLPYVQQLASQPLASALASNPGLLEGLNVHAGHITHPAVAESLGLPYRSPRHLLGIESEQRNGQH